MKNMFKYFGCYKQDKRKSCKLTAFLKTRSWQIRLLILMLGLTMAGLAGYKTFSWWTGQESASILNAPPETVEGNIVTLKLLKEDYYIDYHNMFSATVRKNLELPEYATLGDTLARVQYKQEQTQKRKALHYCIFDNKDKKLIGEVEIRNYDPTDNGQFTCWVNENYWGGGRFREAAQLISKTYFRLKPSENHYIVHVRLWNKRSYLAHKKAGFKDLGYVYEQGKATRYLLEYVRPK